MKLRNVIALVAILGLASEAFGAEVLRRTEEVATAAPAATVETKTVEVKAVDTKPVSVTGTEVKSVEVKAVETKIVETKPTDVVKTPVATPAALKADELRKARESEEVHTESKIVEKLEGERLAEEQKRADRLFNPKIEAPVVAPVPNVTIQKVEIIQPALIQSEAPAAAPVAPTPALPPRTEPAPGAVPVVADAQVEAPYRYYVGVLGAFPMYNDARVTTNFGVGATVGVMIGENYAVEGSFIYSNFNINQGSSSFYNYNTFGNFGRQELDQYEVKATFKWYAFRTLLGESRFKPYVGASAAYIDREYGYSNNTAQTYYNQMYGQSGSSHSTDAFNLGAVVGGDFAVTPSFAIGAFFEYSTPVITRSQTYQNNPNAYGYGYTGSTPVRVDTWDMMTLGLSAKFTF